MTAAGPWIDRFFQLHAWVAGPMVGSGRRTEYPVEDATEASVTPLAGPILPSSIESLARSIQSPATVGVSACLLGIPCRYDGASKAQPGLAERLAGAGIDVIPVCPEVLAGLGTPRPAMEFAGGDGRRLLDGRADLLDEQGRSCSAAMKLGATRSMALVRGCRALLLKERSPSCGVGKVHVGGVVVSGMGVFAAMASREGMALFTENDLEDFFRFAKKHPTDLG